MSADACWLADLGGGAVFYSPAFDASLIPAYTYVGGGAPAGPFTLVAFDGSLAINYPPLIRMVRFGMPSGTIGGSISTNIPSAFLTPVAWPDGAPNDAEDTFGATHDPKWTAEMGNSNSSVWDVIDGSFLVVGAVGLVEYGTIWVSFGTSLGTIVTGLVYEGAPGKLGFIPDEDFKWYYSAIPPYYDGTGYITAYFPDHDKGIVGRVAFGSVVRRCLLAPTGGKAITETHYPSHDVSATFYTNPDGPVFPEPSLTYTAMPQAAYPVLDKNTIILRYTDESQYIEIDIQGGFYRVNFRYAGVDHFQDYPFAQSVLTAGLTVLLPENFDGYQRGIAQALNATAVGNWLVITKDDGYYFIPIPTRFTGTKCGFSVGASSTVGVLDVGGSFISSSPPPGLISTHSSVFIQGFSWVPRYIPSPHPVSIGVAPPLRLKQRDDRFGLVGSARLPLRNTPTSQQGSPAPRVAGRKQYL